jgi:DNA-binding NarL/FixJ family response regulator
MTRIRIVMADHDFHLRESLLDLLAGQEDMQIVGEARNDVQVLRLMKELRPDILLLDARLPLAGGIGTLVEIREINPETRILLFADHPETRFVWLAPEGHHWDCGLMTSPLEGCLDAIRALHSGEFHIANEALELLLNQLLENRGPRDSGDATHALTKRQQEIVRCLAQGMTNKEIARKLRISDKTVKSHLQQIYARLGVHGRLQAVLEQDDDQR